MEGIHCFQDTSRLTDLVASLTSIQERPLQEVLEELNVPERSFPSTHLEVCVEACIAEGLQRQGACEADDCKGDTDVVPAKGDGQQHQCWAQRGCRLHGPPHSNCAPAEANFQLVCNEPRHHSGCRSGLHSNTASQQIRNASPFFGICTHACLGGGGINLGGGGVMIKLIIESRRVKSTSSEASIS